MFRATGIALCGIVLAGSAFLFLYHIGSEPLQDYDEATYAEVVHEAFANHDFLSFTYGGGEYFKKPPLLFWLIGIGEEVTPRVETAVRLPSAFAAIALVAALMLFVYELSQNWYAAAIAGAMLATLSPFMETARQSRFDILVSLFITLSGYCFLRALKDPRWFLVFGVAAGLAVMSKSVIAIFAFVFAGSIALFLWRFDWLKHKYFWGGAGIFFLVAAPWHIYEWLRFGNTFWASYIGTEVVARTQMNLFWTVTITNQDYINYLLRFTQPWLWVFFAAAIATPFLWRKLSAESRAVLAACIATIAVMALVFFTAATKAPTYLMPMYPLAALTVGIAAAYFFSLKSMRVMAIAVSLFLVAYAVPQSVYEAYHADPYFSTEIALAKEENAIGTLIASGPDTKLYVYRDENMGSIMFYSQHLHPETLATSSAPAEGSFIVVGGDATSTLTKDFPALTTRTLYGGEEVSLLEVGNS